MLRKNYFSFLAVAALFLGGTMFVFAQVAPVRGKIVLKKADGTTEPVADATIEVFRTDVKGKLPAGKTDKKGNFSFVGFPLGQTFALSISAPNIEPSVYPSVQGGMQELAIMVVPGDGRRLTEDEAREVVAAALNAGANSTGKTAQTSAEQKKALEEQAKKQAEYESEKRNVENSNAVIKKSLAEGGKAFKEKNYALALAKYDEGIAAAPTFEGSAPTLLNNKALALINRATENYRQSSNSDPATKIAALESIKKDFQDAIVASDRALTVINKAPAQTGESLKQLNANKMDAMKNKTEAYRLMSRTGADRAKGKEALAAFQEYIAAEPDTKIKSAARLSLAQTLQDSNDFDQAIVEFQTILTADPNNIDALGGIGFSLVNVGYVNGDKAKFQEATNYLQKFHDLAPDTNPLKVGARETIETLKAEQNVAPQKGSKTNTKKKP